MPIAITKRVMFESFQIGNCYAGQNIAFWLVDWMQPFFRAWADFTASQHQFLKQEFDLTDMKVGFAYATMNVWDEIWVQGEMCWRLFSFRFTESSLTVEVLDWQCKIKTVQTQLILLTSVWVGKRCTSCMRAGRFKACRGGMSKPT